MRKLFDIYVNDKSYPVYDIEGKEHALGSYNGCPTTWWLLLDGDMDKPKMLDEMSENCNLVPYIDKGVHRICWEINYKQYNRIVTKWSENNIRDGGVCTIKANGRDVYTFNSSDLTSTMANVSVLIEKLMVHPYNFLEPEKDDGRKIFFCGLPAFVFRGYELGEIKIKPDYSNISKEEWWQKYELFNSNHENKNPDDFFDDVDFEEYEADYELFKERLKDYMEDDEINWGNALEDGKIWWFRK
jgi:hypothetical protein